MHKKYRNKKGEPYRIDETDPKWIEEQAALNRWKGSHKTPTLWEKIDKDLAFSSQLRARLPIDETGRVSTQVTLSNRNKVGGPREPKK
jgi:hypothetical protein